MWPGPMGRATKASYFSAMTTPHPVLPQQVVALDLRGRTAMVTGAGSGIGRSVAVRLAAAGARVVAVDRDEAHLKTLTDVVPVVADLSDLDALEDMLPHMYAEGWGRIVNISSVHGLRASPFKAAYVTAKHALEGLSKTIALEGAPHGVTANCINPSYVRTPLVEGQIADQARTHGLAESEVVEKIMLTSAAIKRLIEPEEVAELVAYLCTDVAGFITGTSLSIDGGWTAH
jgi:3-hydroxybutyrate dehydrogenase